MRMRGEIAVFMFCNAMVILARRSDRVHVDCGIGKVAQVMQKVVAHLLGNLVALFNGEAWTYSDVQFCVKPVA